MAKINAPSAEYNGISAMVEFTNGVGETNDPNLISWFKEHGYTVEEEEPQLEKELQPEETEEVVEETPKRKKSGQK